MSGPIVRKYGFPNFDKIFGERELQHGVEEQDDSSPADAGAPAATSETPEKAKPAPKSKKKKS